MLYKKIYKLWPNDVLVRPTEKVSRTSATSGKNESRALSYLPALDMGIWELSKPLCWLHVGGQAYLFSDFQTE